MLGLNFGGLLALAVPFLALHILAVLLARALRTYSRSRLEEVCRQQGRPERADQILHLDERTERGAETLALLTGLVLASLLGAALAASPEGIADELFLGLALAVGALGHLAAGVVGRVHAETLLDTLWPLAVVIRRLTFPFTAIARMVEALVYRSARRTNTLPRPASVEVEIHSSAEDSEDVEADLPESVRSMLERAVEFVDLAVSDVMTPGSGVAMRPATIRARDAVRAFVETGFSRIPLYGESRDDIVGVLYAKDLMARMEAETDPDTVLPREVARPPLFVPETKDAAELLAEFRSRRVHLAIVLDEYGGVAGLVTLEDLIEQIVGPIDDEFDPPAPPDPIVPLGDSRYDLDATLSLEDLNERLGLNLPTDGDFETVGGLAFTELGRVPEPGAHFRFNGVEFTVLEVADHTIRRLRLELSPAPIDANSAGSGSAP